MLTLFINILITVRVTFNYSEIKIQHKDKLNKVLMIHFKSIIRVKKWIRKQF